MESPLSVQNQIYLSTTEFCVEICVYIYSGTTLLRLPLKKKKSSKVVYRKGGPWSGVHGHGIMKDMDWEKVVSKEGWSLIRVIFCQGGFSSGWSFIRVVSHQGGLSSGWFLIRVVSHQGGLSSGWSFVRVVSHQGGHFFRVVSHQGGLSSRWSFVRVVSHQGDLSSGRSFVRVVSHWGGLPSQWSLIRAKVVSHQTGLSSGPPLDQHCQKLTGGQSCATPSQVTQISHQQRF